MTTTDWRELCVELVLHWDAHGCDWKPNHQAIWEATISRVRFLLDQSAGAITADAAFAMGQTGGPSSEAERLAFEAWMKGHSWLVAGTWNGVTYDDRGGNRYGSVDHDAMQTRMLWAAWRDRAALDAAPEGKPSDQELADPFAQCYLDSSALRGTSYLSGVRTAARTALAQPEPAAPTDEELFCLEDLRDAWNAQADPINSWDELGMDEIIWFAQQQALTRWGRPTPQPIPVSERLPGPGDCDAEGRCWWWIVDQPGEFPYWILAHGDVVAWAGYTHWLPHWV